MELTRPCFNDHPFRRPLYARLDICARGERPMGFTPENRFGAGGKRRFCWSQRQAGLAVQPFFGLGFRLRWSGRRWRDCPYSGMESVARVRVVDVFVRIGARFVRIGARFVRIGARFARIGARFARIDARFARIDARFARIDARFAHEFRGIGADWGVWGAPSPRFSSLPPAQKAW